MTFSHLCLACGDDRFTRKMPFCTQWPYAKIVLSAKILTVSFVRDDLMRILYCPRKYGVSVLYKTILCEDRTIHERTEGPFLYATIECKTVLSAKERIARFCSQQSSAEFILFMKGKRTRFCMPQPKFLL